MAVGLRSSATNKLPRKLGLRSPRRCSLAHQRSAPPRCKDVFPLKSICARTIRSPSSNPRTDQHNGAVCSNIAKLVGGRPAQAPAPAAVCAAATFQPPATTSCPDGAQPFPMIFQFGFRAVTKRQGAANILFVRLQIGVIFGVLMPAQVLVTKPKNGQEPPGIYTL